MVMLLADCLVGTEVVLLAEVLTLAVERLFDGVNVVVVSEPLAIPVSILSSLDSIFIALSRNPGKYR